MATKDEVHVEEPSLGTLVSRMASDMSDLIRKEIELAKIETKEEVTNAAKAGSKFGGAAVSAHMALLFVSIALALLLDHFMPSPLAFAIVGVVYAVAAAVLAKTGQQQIKSLRTLPETKETIPGGRPMGEDTQQLRREISSTREDLGDTFDQIEDRVSPRRIVERKKSRIKQSVTNFSDKIIGNIDYATGAATNAIGDMKDGAQTKVDSVHNVADTAKEQASGAPLLAGAVAAGIGFLASVAFPATKAEENMAQQLERKAQPLIDQAKQEGSEIAGELKEKGMQSADQLKQSATDHVEVVKETAQQSAEDVKSTAQSKGQEVKEDAKSRKPSA